MNDIIDLKIHQIMTHEVIAARLDNKFSQVLTFFVERNINHIPVVEKDGTIIGIISNKDALRCLYKKIVANIPIDFSKMDSEITIESIMTPDPYTVDVESSVESVKNLIAKATFNALPITKNGKLAGIVTVKDLLRVKVIKIDGADYNPI